MRLRELEEKDAPYMLEWMHDKNVCSYLGKDFIHMKEEDCLSFIRGSRGDEQNRHYAIVDDRDEYMGTISLKEIQRNQGRAEYAISCRTKAMGKGYAREATRELFRIAREELGLDLLYLNVYDFNLRAQKMYEKMGFLPSPRPEFITGETDERLLWYQKELG